MTSPTCTKPNTACASPACLVEKLRRIKGDAATVRTAFDAADALSAQQDLIRRMVEGLEPLVEEFGGTISQYHKIGPDYTLRDGTEVFEVSAVLDREPLIETIRALIVEAKGDKDA